MVKKFIKPTYKHKPIGTGQRAEDIELSEAPDESPTKSGATEERSIDGITLASLGVYMLFEEVDSSTIKNLCEFLIKAQYVFPNDKADALTLLLNSPGGDVFDGFAVIDLMNVSRVPIQTMALGSVASMAAVIFAAGTKGRRFMSKNAYLMTHQMRSEFEGKYHEFVAQRDLDDELHERFVKHFVEHSKMTEKQVRDVILGKEDKWLSAKEAVKYGLCDGIKDGLR